MEDLKPEQMGEKLNVVQTATRTSEDEKTPENGVVAVDPEADRRLVRKMDLHIIPPLMLLSLFCFLDRFNIGNAKIQGMTKELHMKGHDFNVALFVFFIPYVSNPNIT
jgi:hypothetical protein